jgi:hypothetical protein
LIYVFAGYCGKIGRVVNRFLFSLIPGVKVWHRQKIEVRFQTTDVRGQMTEYRGQMTEYRGQRTEDRGQRTEYRGQRTEDRGQNTEDRGQKTEDRGQRAEARGQKLMKSDPPSSDWSELWRGKHAEVGKNNVYGMAHRVLIDDKELKTVGSRRMTDAS